MKHKPYIFANKEVTKPTKPGEYSLKTLTFCRAEGTPAFHVATPGIAERIKPEHLKQWLTMAGNCYPNGADAKDVFSRGLRFAEPPQHRPSSILEMVPTTGAPPNWLVNEDFFTRGECILLNSGTGAGKSTLMVNMLVPWALGESWMGFQPNGPLKTLILNGENTNWSIAKTVTNYLNTTHRLNDTPTLEMLRDNIHFIHRPKMTGQELIDEIYKHVTQHDYDLIVVDPLFAFLDNIAEAAGIESARTFVRFQLEALAEELNLGILITHHFSKASTKDDDLGAFSGSGTSDLANACREVINLRSHSDPSLASQGVQVLKWYKRMTCLDGQTYTNELILQRGDYGESFYRAYQAPEPGEHDIKLPNGRVINALQVLQVIKSIPSPSPKGPNKGEVTEAVMMKLRVCKNEVPGLLNEVTIRGLLSQLPEKRSIRFQLTKAGEDLVSTILDDMSDDPF